MENNDAERLAFNFYRSYADIAIELSDKDRLAFYDALIARQFTGKEPLLTGLAKFAYISQKHSIDKQVTGYERAKNVKLGQSKPPLGSPPTLYPPSPIGSPPKEGKEEGKEEGKKSIDVRKLTFKNSLWNKFKKDFRVKTLEAFYLYWTEHGDNDKKMRFEKEKSFSIERRLKRWAKNDFDKTENPIEEKGKGSGGVSMEELYNS